MTVTLRPGRSRNVTAHSGRCNSAVWARFRHFTEAATGAVDPKRLRRDASSRMQNRTAWTERHSSAVHSTIRVPVPVSGGGIVPFVTTLSDLTCVTFSAGEFGVNAAHDLPPGWKFPQAFSAAWNCGELGRTPGGGLSTMLWALTVGSRMAGRPCARTHATSFNAWLTACRCCAAVTWPLFGSRCLQAFQALTNGAAWRFAWKSSWPWLVGQGSPAGRASACTARTQATSGRPYPPPRRAGYCCHMPLLAGRPRPAQPRAPDPGHY